MTVTTLNPATKAAAVTLSGGNLTWSGSSVGAALSTTSKTSGKWYFEGTYTTLNGNIFIGIANTSFVVTTSQGLGGNNSAAMWNGSPSIEFVNNVNIQDLPANIAAGHVIGIAVDFTNGLLWCIDWSAVSPTWIGSGLGTPSPSAGTGGAGLSSIWSGGATMFAAAGLFNSGGTGTINFGDTAFTGSVPSGFLAWDSTVAAPALYKPKKQFRKRPFFKPQFRAKHRYEITTSPAHQSVQAPFQKRQFKKLRHRPFFPMKFRPKHIIFPPKQPAPTPPVPNSYLKSRRRKKLRRDFFPRQFRPRHAWGLPAGTAGGPIGTFMPTPGTGIENQRLTQPELVDLRAVLPILYELRQAAATLYPEESVPNVAPITQPPFQGTIAARRRRIRQRKLFKVRKRKLWGRGT